ncbi:class IIb bacteriocin, lactobin A/cerein 7B family [Synechococcus sp. MIT S9451]|uniref:class IIb bacteriocin, lactobin A/cerein 7B family n=1 Tax=Synechococcus sp. MIT S9451 TaxID=3082543 RepID=UPI0039B598BB
MTELNTDYNNTELLDQELSFDELQEVNGGVAPLVFGVLGIIQGIAGITYQATKRN